MSVSMLSCDTIYSHSLFLNTASRQKPTKTNQSQNYFIPRRAKDLHVTKEIFSDMHREQWCQKNKYFSKRMNPTI